MTNHPSNQSKLTAEQLSELTCKLLEEKKWLEEHFAKDDNYEIEDGLRTVSNDLSMYDNHPGDLGTETYEREKDLALNEHTERHLSDVKNALQRVETGEYGVCHRCGKTISFERLLAIPTTSYCVEHVPNRYSSDRRPAEEEILWPSFGRTSKDEVPEIAHFDGEDAWQIVANYGTSNTPAMAGNPNESDSYQEMETDADENDDGYVEAYESFLATDIHGEQLTVIRNKYYYNYMENGEGEGLLEPDKSAEQIYD